MLQPIHLLNKTLGKLLSLKLRIINNPILHIFQAYRLRRSFLSNHILALSRISHLAFKMQSNQLALNIPTIKVNNRSQDLMRTHIPISLNNWFTRNPSRLMFKEPSLREDLCNLP